MERLIIDGPIHWASNVGAVVSGLFVKVHASQQTLQIYVIGKCGPILQNLNFSQIYVWPKNDLFTLPYNLFWHRNFETIWTRYNLSYQALLKTKMSLK